MSLLPSLHTHINVNGQAKHRHQGCTVASSPPSGVHSNFTCRACVQSEPRAFELGGGYVRRSTTGARPLLSSPFLHAVVAHMSAGTEPQ